MRNPGGSACTAERLLSYLMPDGFEGAQQEVRVIWTDLLEVYYALETARQKDPPPTEDIERLEALLAEYQKAYVENRGWTRPLPICGATLDRAPAKDTAGDVVVYRKPIMVLVDEMTASAGDLFAALIQDNRRGLLFGMRTMGAGGSPGTYSFDVGAYSEGEVDLTQTLVVRKAPITTPDYPPAPYIENIGVRPDIECDYMTRENLVNKGKAFVEAFTKAMVEYIRGKS